MKTLLFLVACILFISSSAMACSCLKITVGDALQRADAVFVGQVMNVQYVDAKPDTTFYEQRIIVTFNVYGYWKGEVGQTITLHTFYNQFACGGYFFKEGEEFIVYAKKYTAEEWLDTNRTQVLPGAMLPEPSDVIFTTNICSRTNHLENADEDLAELGTIQAPFK